MNIQLHVLYESNTTIFTYYIGIYTNIISKYFIITNENIN